MSRCVSVEKSVQLRDAQTQTDDAASSLGFEPEGGGGPVCPYSYSRGADLAGAKCCSCVCASGDRACWGAPAACEAASGVVAGPVEEWERIEVSPETVRRKNLDAIRRLGGGPEAAGFLAQFHCPDCGARKEIVCLDGDRALQRRYGVYFGGTLFLCPKCGHEAVNKDL